ncbi:nucleotidyltransferase domain-containing protein [Myxococcota bacterium]|nr:nucleotidyltransferase domain-containing protein [Myxococcota bacterium]
MRLTDQDIQTIAPPGSVAGALFGSQVKGAARPGSDVDLLFIAPRAATSYFKAWGGLDLHISTLPPEALSPPPPKWWEPLSSAKALSLGDQGWMAGRIEVARARWGDAEARENAAAAGRRHLWAKINAPPPHLRAARLRSALDGLRGLRCFELGWPEPSKHRRVSGLEARLGPWGDHSGALGLRAITHEEALRRAVEGFPALLDHLRVEPADALRRSLLEPGAPNRWARAVAASRDPRDACFYLSFSLDKLLEAARDPAGLIARPWYQEITHALRASPPNEAQLRAALAPR